MGLFSVFSSSSSSSSSAAPPPAPAAGRARAPPAASSDPSSSKGARTASRTDRPSSDFDADPFASSSSLAGPSRAGGGTPKGSSELNRTGARRGDPPPYPGASQLGLGASKVATPRSSRDSDGGEFVAMGAFVSETVTTTTTTTFFPALFRRHHAPSQAQAQLKQPPPPPPPPLPASFPLPDSPHMQSTNITQRAASQPTPSKTRPRSRSRSRARGGPGPGPAGVTPAHVQPLPRSPDLPALPPSSGGSSRHASASATVGQRTGRLSSEEKGKGKGLPDLPWRSEDRPSGSVWTSGKTLPKTPSRASSQEEQRQVDEPEEMQSNEPSTLSPHLLDPPARPSSELKAFVHRGPARGASIVVTPSSPLLGGNLEIPPDPGLAMPETPFVSAPSSPARTAAVPLPASSPSSDEDFKTPPGQASPLPSSPSERSAQKTLARRTSQMSLGHGYPSASSTPPPPSPPRLEPIPPTPNMDHEGEEAFPTRVPSPPLVASPPRPTPSIVIPRQPRADLPMSPPMLVPPTFPYSTTSTSILSTSSPASVSWMPVSFDPALHPSSSTVLPSGARKPVTKRTSSMDLFSFASSQSTSSSKGDWRQRVKRRSSASALTGADTTEKDRARSKTGAVFAVPALPTPKTPLEDEQSQPSSSVKSTPSRRLSLWGRRQTTNASAHPESAPMSASSSLDIPQAEDYTPLPLFDLGKRFSFGEAGMMGASNSSRAKGGASPPAATSEGKQEVLVDSPTDDQPVTGLGLGFGEDNLEARDALRVDTNSREGITPTGSAFLDLDSMPSSPHAFAPSPTHSTGSGRPLGPLFEHHAAASSTSSFPGEPHSAVSSSRSSISHSVTSSAATGPHGLPLPGSPSQSQSLQRPSLSPMRSNSSSSVGGRIRESMFGARPSPGRARSSSTLLGAKKSSGDGLFGLMDNLKPPQSPSAASASAADPFGSVSSARSLSPSAAASSSSFLSTDPAASIGRSSLSSSSSTGPSSKTGTFFRRPRSATSPQPADLLFPVNFAGAPTSSPSKRPGSIRRLSSALFDSKPSSFPSSVPNSLTTSPSSTHQTLRRDTSASLFPLPSRTSSSSSIMLSPVSGSGRRSPSKRRESNVSSGGGSSRGGSGEVSRAREPTEVPLREEEESPETWLRRLLEAVPKYEVANVLAVSGDAFHVAALRAYMSAFDFSGKPLDVALRRLLMEVALPRETQQIDRVMESFAKQYIQGNPALFTNEDHPYILAFSLIMLHTDAFNKSNKNKMSKADYIKNTRLDGVLPEVLDAFFDNITFTPFVFVEDDDTLTLPSRPSDSSHPTSSSLLDPSTSLFSTSSPMPSSISASRIASSSSSSKVDVYYLISADLTHTLRADVASHIPTEDPFSYHGGPGRTTFETTDLHAAFVGADIIEIAPPPVNGSGARKASTGSLLGEVPKPLTLRLTKFGVLSRKDDLGDGGKKASNRKWRDWTVILTGSQLLFFKDPAWATVFQKQTEEHANASRRGSESSQGSRITLPKMSAFKPDEVLSVKDAIAITETSYNKYPNAFRFVMPHGRQYLLQATDETELTEWMSRINYAASFKTASVRMRGMGMDSTQAQLAGAAAAASHARALRSEDSSFKASGSTASGFSTPSGAHAQMNGNPFAEAFSPSASHKSAFTPSTSPNTRPAPPLAPPRSPLFGPRLRSLSRPTPVDLESPIFSPGDDGQQLETAFMEIKAELAAGRGGATRLSTSSSTVASEGRARASSVDATGALSVRSSFERTSVSSRAGLNTLQLPAVPPMPTSHASRSEALRYKVDSLQSKISSTSQHLSSELRIARNLAVLTPFQRSTRERIQATVGPLAKKVRHLRMELARLRCYEEVLRTDLLVEGENWRAVKSIAHQAAQTSLRSSASAQGTPAKPTGLPSLEVSLHTGTTPPRTGPIGIPPPSEGSANANGRRVTSLRTSARPVPIPIPNPVSLDPQDDLPSLPPSDDDSDADDADTDADDPTSQPSKLPSHTTPTHQGPSSWPRSLLSAAPASPSPAPSPLSPSTGHTPPLSPSPKSEKLPGQEQEQEQEESPTDWKSTRAAKRVSLANVPESTVRKISLRLGGGGGRGGVPAFTRADTGGERGRVASLNSAVQNGTGEADADGDEGGERGLERGGTIKPRDRNGVAAGGRRRARSEEGRRGE